MTEKTWFFPPDFTFLPDGEIRLGMVLEDYRYPTRALASLNATDTPTVQLPEVTSITERGHSRSDISSGSEGANFLTKLVNRAEASGSVDASRFRDFSCGEVDHEIRCFSEGFKPEALSAIVKLGRVKRYMRHGRGVLIKYPVYVITGLRVAKQSFRVTNNASSTKTISTEGKLSVSEAPLPLRGGAGATADRQEHRTNEYCTAPGIIVAYRLHVIRAKFNKTLQSEMFYRENRLCTGNGNRKFVQEMEVAEVTSEMVMKDEDMWVESKMEEHFIDDTVVVVVAFTSS